MERTLLRYVRLYNHQLPQSAIKSQTPLQAMKAWYASHPHLKHGTLRILISFIGRPMIVRDVTHN